MLKLADKNAYYKEQLDVYVYLEENQASQRKKYEELIGEQHKDN